MTYDPHQALIDELDALLDQERAVLTAGRLEALPGLLEAKETLIDQLNALNDMTPERLQPLRGKAQRNQALLDGALRGIRTVANRFLPCEKSATRWRPTTGPGASPLCCNSMTTNWKSALEPVSAKGWRAPAGRPPREVRESPLVLSQMPETVRAAVREALGNDAHSAPRILRDGAGRETASGIP